MISLLSATGVIAIAAATTNIGTSGNIDVSAGRLPLSTQGSIDTVTTTWSPRVSIGLSSARTDWVTSYAQRIWWREPNTIGRARPFTLHLASSNLTRQLSRTWFLDVGLSGSAGDLDYFSLQTVLGTSQSALPPTVQSVAAYGSANAGLTWNASRRWRLAGNLVTSYADDYGEVDVLFRTASVSSTLRADFAVSRLAGLGPGLFSSYQLILDTALLDLRPFFSWGQRFTRFVDVRATAGLAVAIPSRTNVVGAAAVTPVSGTLTASVGIEGPSRASLRWSHAGEVSIAPRADLVLNTYIPRLSTSWTSIARVNNDWTFSPAVTFSTNISAAPQPGAPFETLYGFRLPIAWQAERHHSLSVTGYAGFRAAHLAAANSATRPEYTVTLGYSYRFGAVASGAPRK